MADVFDKIEGVCEKIGGYLQILFGAGVMLSGPGFWLGMYLDNFALLTVSFMFSLATFGLMVLFWPIIYYVIARDTWRSYRKRRREKYE